MRSFEKFVDSPYFNTSEATAKLFKEIRKFYPEFDDENFTKEFLFEKVYGKVTFSDDLTKKLLSNLIHLSERFLSVENHIWADVNLLYGLCEKKLYKQFTRKLKSVTGGRSESLISEDVFLIDSLIEVEKCIYFSNTNKFQEFEESVLNLFNYDTLYYYYRLAKSLIRAKHASVYNPTGKERLVLSIVNSIDFEKLRNDLTDVDVIKKDILMNFIDMIQLEITKDELLYKRVKEFSILYSTIHPLHPQEGIYLGVLYILKFLNYKIRNGNREYLYERHEVYKQLEKYTYSKDPQQVSFVLFDNWFFSGIMTGDFKFSKYISSKYLPFIESRGDEKLKNFYTAWIFFIEKKFTESLKLISTFNTTILTLNGDILITYIKRIELQLNFELGHFETALNQIDSLNHFLKVNKKINDSLKKSLTKFMKVFRQLVMLKLKGKDFNLREAKNKFERDISVSRDWILEKIKEAKQIN
jgi:hypothetical protein